SQSKESLFLPSKIALFVLSSKRIYFVETHPTANIFPCQSMP
ncbi:unnamed protein product, partial [Linum tenue]